MWLPTIIFCLVDSFGPTTRALVMRIPLLFKRPVSDFAQATKKTALASAFRASPLFR